MRRTLLAPAVLLFLAAVASSAHAHHSHPYFYDECKSVTLEGRVERIEFKNPHSLIFLRLDDGAAYTVDWAGLRGLTNTDVLGPAKAALVPGVRVVVTGNRIRTAAEIRAHFPDFPGNVNPNTVDPISIRRVGDSFSWALPPRRNPPDCTAK
jgi:hypothetical protein